MMTTAEKKDMLRLKEELGTRFCRRCDYCQPCSAGIPIQVVLSLRAIMKCMGPQAVKGMAASLIEKARVCTECGECEPRCPYELPIPELLKSTITWAAIEMAKN
jgi:hypothetical protein